MKTLNEFISELQGLRAQHGGETLVIVYDKDRQPGDDNPFGDNFGPITSVETMMERQSGNRLVDGEKFIAIR